ncbi:soluble lytic murein transglycosylase-like protein [Agrobacterium vitis]|nr:soluble lytic murein transglycosylase-like protein [Agrobacterium vitis]MBE1437794.1 soluble lytic murein transglycosylase-like protein [Agrobacterium vitis]
MKTHLFAAAACIAITMPVGSYAHASEAGNVPTLMDMLRGDKEQSTTKDDSKPELGQNDGKRPYHALISSYAKQYGVSAELASAVVKIESNFNARARGAHGEIGLMQIKPATARAMGYTGNTAGLYDPATNLKYGIKYLAMAHQLGGGDMCSAILRYNAGHGATRMNPTSRRYCGQVQAMIGEKA